jgi:glycosyltransferase involved in cell wall biosynthesis
MACGKALVSTPIGCTGLGLRDGHDVLIRKDWGEFARAVCDLLRDELLRAQIGGNARRTAEERFSWNDIADLAFESYLAVLGRGESVDSEVREREYR